jgi:2-C-methyl-D-erythritol 4-phosphate cytidylyltransferase
MNVAIVVAGGKGARFGSDRPKQFLELDGIPIIIHTLRQFERSGAIAEVVVVLPATETASIEPLLKKFEIKKVARVVAGGATRAQSVQSGLRAIEAADLVAIHDAVRPLVTPEEIERVVKVAAASGAAILTAPVSDTIKHVVDGQVSATLPRAALRRALTPQCFRLDLLQKAYAALPEIEASGVDVSDDSILVERLGISIVAVEGNAGNIKITTPADLAVAEVLLGG